MADIFDEVDDDLRADRARRLLLRYGVVVVAGAVLVVAGAASWQAWTWYQDRQAATVATRYFAAMRLAAAPAPAGASPAQTADRATASTDFAAIAASAPEGYATLSRLWGAALDADGGRAAQAQATWARVSDDSAADPLLRGFATLMAVSRQIDAGDPAALQQKLIPLLDPTGPWHALAEEAQALLDLRAGKPEDAKQVLHRLAQDVTAPQGVRGRANGLLNRLGG